MKKKGMKAKKIPWGIFAGFFGMVWSFLFVAIVAVYAVSGMMYAEVGGDDGLRDSWFLMPMMIAEIATAVGCAICLLLYRIRENKKG